MLKSLYFFRNNPIHMHIIVNNISEKILKVLFETWAVPQVNVSFYNSNTMMSDVRWVPNVHYSGINILLKLTFTKIVAPKVTEKIIVLDTDLIFNADILELWLLFKNFNRTQVIGLIENQSDFYLKTWQKPWPAFGRGYNTGVMLYHLERLRSINWDKLWANVTKRTAMMYSSTRLGDQDIINAVIKENPEILYEVPCGWNTQLSDHSLSYNCYNYNKIKIVHWNSPKKFDVINKDSVYFRNMYTTFVEYNGNLLRRQLYNCSGISKNVTDSTVDVCYDFYKGQNSKWRTILFFREFKYVPVGDVDVTYVVQSSFDRIQLIEELCKYWEGPISLTLYMTDPEFEECRNYLSESEILRDRLNIAYHVVFKDGKHYPINVLRNVGLQNVKTPYVFLADIDFVPSVGIYSTLKEHIHLMKPMNKKALIVPAFETQRYRSRIPKNKSQLIEMLKQKSVFIFRYDVWASGHAPTNYAEWVSATVPYIVKWEHDFEPYIVVKSDVTEYDNRFMGFGWNKVSHIMELQAQNYEFIVLPNVFIIHKAHTPSNDILKFRKSPMYRMCLQNLKDSFVNDIKKKYGWSVPSKNTLPPAFKAEND